MADRFYGYQYDTNPRKLNTDYNPYKRRYPQKNEPVTTTSRNRLKNSRRNSELEANREKNKTNRVQRTSNKQEKITPEYRRKQVTNENDIVQNNIQNAKNTTASVKAKLKIVMFLVAAFSVLFAISYQNSLISESFNRKEQYKKEMEALNKTNQQIEVSIENNLNLNNVEQVAKEKIGMKKLGNDQKIYVSLPKEDYVAPAAEQVVIEENLNFFEKIIRSFSK